MRIALLLFVSSLALCEPPRSVARDKTGLGEASIEVSYPPKYDGPDTLGLLDPGIKMFRIRRLPTGVLALQVGEVHSGKFGDGFIPLAAITVDAKSQEPAIVSFLNQLIDDPIAAHVWTLQLKNAEPVVSVGKWHLVVDPIKGTIDGLLADELIRKDNWGRDEAAIRGRFGIDAEDLGRRIIELPTHKIDLHADGQPLIPAEKLPTPSERIKTIIRKQAERTMKLVRVVEEAKDQAEFDARNDSHLTKLEEEKAALVSWLRSIPTAVFTRLGWVDWEKEMSTLELIDLGHVVVYDHLRLANLPQETSELKTRVKLGALERQVAEIHSLNDLDSRDYARERVSDFLRGRGVSLAGTSDSDLVERATEFLEDYESGKIKESSPVAQRPWVKSIQPKKTDSTQRDLRRAIGVTNLNTPGLLTTVYEKMGALSLMVHSGVFAWDPQIYEKVMAFSPTATVATAGFGLLYATHLARHAKEFAQGALLRIKLAALTAGNQMGGRCDFQKFTNGAE